MKLPALSEEMYQYYPAMSAQTHEAEVKGYAAKAVLAATDPALIGIADQMKESGGQWLPCTGCYDTEDGYPTRKYAYSPALQTAIGYGCDECGGLGAVWWHMTDEERAQFEKDCAEIDSTGSSNGGDQP